MQFVELFVWTFDLSLVDSWCVDQNACAMYGKEHCASYDWIDLNCPKLCGHCGNGECNLISAIAVVVEPLKLWAKGTS